MADGFTMRVDVKSLTRALKKVDGDISDLKEAHLKAAEIVLDEWRLRAPEDTGEFKRGGFAKGLQAKGVVDVLKKGPPYAGVIEGGGSIRRHNSKHRTFVKPKRGSYYLVPAMEDKLEKARDIIMDGVEKVMTKAGLR